MNRSRIADILVDWLWIHLLCHHDLRLIKVCLHVWLITSIPIPGCYLRQFYYVYAREIFTDLFITIVFLNCGVLLLLSNKLLEDFLLGNVSIVVVTKILVVVCIAYVQSTEALHSYLVVLSLLHVLKVFFASSCMIGTS